MNRSKDRNEFRIVALLLTLIISAGGVLILVNSFLHYQYPPEDMKDLAALEQDSIMFGGEYVMLGTSPEAVGEEIDTEEPEQPQEVQPKPDVAGDDLADAGEPAKQPKPVVTAKQESPMKVKEKPKEKEKPKKTGPATDEKPAEKQEQVKRGVDAATESKVKNAFGKSSGAGSGKTRVLGALRQAGEQVLQARGRLLAGARDRAERGLLDLDVPEGVAVKAALHEREVKLARPDRAEEVGGVRDASAERAAGAHEAHEQRREQELADGERRADPQRRGVLAAQALDDLRAVDDEGVKVVDELPRAWRKLHAPAPTGHERHAEVGLERLDLLRHGGLADVEALGGARERPGPCEGPQRVQPIVQQRPHGVLLSLRAACRVG